MLTGERKGQDLDITSSSGYLFGAACKPGMRVIVMQSVAGDSTVASVYTQDREGVIYIFAFILLTNNIFYHRLSLFLHFRQMDFLDYTECFAPFLFVL